MTDVVTATLQVDLKRRTTLPGDILAAAGIPPGSTLVARVEEPGRIVLESPQLLLALLQDDIAAAMTADLSADLETGETALVDQLTVDHGADTGEDLGRQGGAGPSDAREPAGADRAAGDDQGDGA